MTKEDWNWWAGRDEEWMGLGQYNTREDAIEGGRDGMGEGEGDFVILEALNQSAPPIDADIVINDYLYSLSEDSTYYSGESDYAEWTLPKDRQVIATEELQVALTAWSEKWLIPNMTAPDVFAATRNLETISNTVDPDMLPGGHDNPREQDPAS